jgi:hypothetical protein
MWVVDADLTSVVNYGTSIQWKALPVHASSILHDPLVCAGPLWTDLLLGSRCTTVMIKLELRREFLILYIFIINLCI